MGGSVDYTFTITNRSFNDDSYTLGVASGAFPATVLDATCTSPATSVSVASGASADVCVHVTVPAGTAGGATDTATLTATSTGDPSVSGSGTATTIAVDKDILVVDNDHHGNEPLPDVRAFYTDALTANGKTFDVWDLQTNPVLPLGYMKAHTTIVWFTGASYPDPVGPYEGNLAAFLDGGGRLFMSGQDILDQAAGTAALLPELRPHRLGWQRDQNDKATTSVNGVTGNPVTDGIGTVPLDLSVLGLDFQFMDRITPIAPATAAFKDDSAASRRPHGGPGAYKIVFLGFPFEEYGSAAQKADLMNRVLTYFGP